MATLTRPVPARHARHAWDSHDFPTRRYDLVKEFVIALLVMTLVTVLLAAIFSSPDEKAITMQRWAQADPNDVVATAAGELAGTTTSAGYGAPYNHAAEGQKVLGIPLQKWGGVRIPVNSQDLVLQPLEAVKGDSAVSQALTAWKGASADQQQSWATAYTDALDKAKGDPGAVAAGDYGPVPALATGLLSVARSGGLEGALTSSGTFYGGDQTRSLLLLADGAFLEDTAVAQHLGGDQWGMMNEVGNYPGQAWLTPMTFFYQVEPFASSDNADALIWGLMGLISLLMLLVPFLPGVRSVPKALGVYKLVWRDAYRMRR